MSRHDRYMSPVDHGRLDPPVLTRHDVAELLNLSVRTIDRLVAAGELSHHRLADLVRFTQADVTEYIDQSRVSPR